MDRKKRDLKEVFKTPWFRLVAEENPKGDPFYFIDTDDYVSVVATTDQGEFVLVRQYRATVGEAVFELPSGHVDPGESPKEAAARELMEETGYGGGEIIQVGPEMVPDTGRLCNRLWCFYAKNVVKSPPAGWKQPEEIETHIWTREEMIQQIRSGGFNHALNLTAILYAVWDGQLDLPWRRA